jgi:hypothetical protein
LDDAVFQLKFVLKDQVKLQKPPRKKAVTWDGRFVLEGKNVYVVAHEEVHTVDLDRFLALKQELGEVLVAARYISPKSKLLLAENGIHYLDNKGNMRLRIGQVHLHVDGIPNAPPKQPVRTRLFAKSGLRVLFIVLLDPNALNEGYRQLAHRAMVSLGTLPALYKALQEEGYLVRGEAQKWTLVGRDRLLQNWVQEYASRLKPSLKVGQFQAPHSDFAQQWKSIHMAQGALWGGESGADLLTDYLQPSRFTLYSDASRTEIIKAYRWRPQAEGAITVFQKFWKGDVDFDKAAQPLLVYADLVDQGDGRSMEVAKMIYDQYLRHV